MKNLKNVTSCLLIITILMLSHSAAFAISTNENVVTANKEVMNISEIVLSNDSEGNIILRGEDYLNGDVCFYLVENGKIISSSYLDREKMISTHTDYKTNVVTIEDFSNIQLYNYSDNSTVSTLAANSYKSAGKVGYLLYRTTQGETFKYGPSYLNVQYLKETFSPQYDVKGKYKDATELAVKLAAWFFLPAGKLITVAYEILDEIGVVRNAIDIVIGTKYVRADQTKVTWRAEGGTSSQQIVGSMYAFKLDGKHLQTEYDGDYFPTTSIKNKNSTLALNLAKKYYPGFTKYEIYSWG